MKVKDLLRQLQGVNPNAMVVIGESDELFEILSVTQIHVQDRWIDDGSVQKMPEGDPAVWLDV